MTTRDYHRFRLATTGLSAPAFRRVANRRRASRASLVWGFVAFVAASLALAVSLETTKPEWRDPEFGHRLTRLVQLKQPAVVVVGSSRTQNAIAPAVMRVGEDLIVFNFGQSGATPLRQLLTLHRLLAAGVRPAAVVVELFPPLLAVDGPAEHQCEDIVVRLSHGDLRHLVPYNATPTGLRNEWMMARATPWLAQRQVLMSHWAPRWQPLDRRIDFQWEIIDPDGFSPIGILEPDYRERAGERARKAHSDAFQNFRPGSTSVRAIQDLIRECRDQSLPLAFFVPPLSPRFRGAFSPGVLKAGEDYARGLLAESQVPLFAAWTDGVEDEFMDGHHMLKHGAERYSRWLADTHIKPWLAQSRRNGP